MASTAVHIICKLSMHVKSFSNLKLSAYMITSNIGYDDIPQKRHWSDRYQDDSTCWRWCYTAMSTMCL